MARDDAPFTAFKFFPALLLLGIFEYPVSWTPPSTDSQYG